MQPGLRTKRETPSSWIFLYANEYAGLRLKVGDGQCVMPRQSRATTVTASRERSPLFNDTSRRSDEARSWVMDLFLRKIGDPNTMMTIWHALPAPSTPQLQNRP
jgi:hypothetical protein